MKKVLIGLLSGAMLLTACQDLFVDRVAVHNGLIDRMDALLAAEEEYYSEYYDIEDGDASDDLVGAYEEFESQFQLLDEYFSETRFASTQEIFVEHYGDEYKGLVEDYLSTAGEFVEEVKEDGFNFEEMEEHFEELDKFGDDFVDAHNKLIDLINLQADPEDNPAYI